MQYEDTVRNRAEKIEEVTDEQWESINPFNREKVEEFLYESVHLSPNSLKQYRSGLRIFYWWVEEVLHGKNLYEIKKRDFMRYQNSLVRRGVSSNGIKFKRSTVSSMNKYLINFYEDEEEFLTFRNFVEGVPNPAPNVVYNKNPLSEDEVEKIKKTLLEDKEYQILAAFSSLYDTGARRSEILLLKKNINSYKKIENSEGEFTGIYRSHEVRTKGRGEQGLMRPLYLSEEAIGHIKLWLDYRGEDDCDFIFAAKRNGVIQPISKSTVNYWFSEVISDIVGRRVNPHIVRSSRSTHLIAKSDGKLTQAQKLLGHKSSETTAQFYNLNKDEDTIEDMF